MFYDVEMKFIIIPATSCLGNIWDYEWVNRGVRAKKVLVYIIKVYIIKEALRPFSLSPLELKNLVILYLDKKFVSN